jgi:predicted ATPase
VLERALGDYVRERDHETMHRFGNDTQVSATNFLALAEWHLGELERARRLIDESTRHAAELGHVPAVASALYFKSVIECRRGDVPATRLGAESLLALTEEHNMKTYADLGQIYANWARGRQFDPKSGADGLRRALQSWLNQGNKSGAPSFHGLLAELEAMQADLDGALTLIDQGLAIAKETGEHYTDPYLYRLRGETLRAMIPPIRPLPKRPSKQRSRLRSNKARAVTNFSHRLPSPSSINQSAGQSTRMQFSDGRSKAFR